MSDVRDALAALIERDYQDGLGRDRRVPEATATRLVDALRASLGGGDPAGEPRAGGRSFLPDRPRCWGIAAQLYGLRSARNWGIGDFTDLRRLVELAAAAGADFVGISPLHARYAADPARCSPYSPSSREFLNVLHLDPAAMIDYAEPDSALGSVGGGDFQALLAGLRAGATVAYPELAAVKHGAFHRAFDRFERRAQAAPDDAAVRDFGEFIAARGEPLRRFALYQALSSLPGYGPDWSRWPAEFRDPAGAAAAAWGQRHAQELRYHAYLQWQADRQLGACAEAARRGGMRIGLYLDLALGCGPDSAEGWAGQTGMVPGFYLGAPSDDLNVNGQDWGLFATNPVALVRDECRRFRRTLAANMRHAGAVRIDHVLGLNRLFLVPAGGTPVDGAYVRMPFDALTAAIAAESCARRCLIVGEDLGTMPPSLPPRLAAAGILSYRVLAFMRNAGGYAPLDEYPRDALVALATHDLPTWRGFWEGRDIAVKYALGIHPPHLTGDEARAVRAAERDGIRAALARAGLDPGDDAAALATAAHRFIARTPARLAAVQLEDLAQEIDQANLPGAPAAGYPCFARKLGRDLDAIFAESAANAILEAMRSERPRGGETG